MSQSLALAIEQAAELIKNVAIGGPSIASTYESFKERQKDLPERAIEMRSKTLSSSYHNMGNLEHTEGNTDEAMRYTKRAISIRLERGAEGEIQRRSSSPSPTSASPACISFSVLTDESRNIVAQSEALFFLCITHTGTSTLLKSAGREQKQAYEARLKICLASFPIHPITAAAYYSLGYTEEKKGNMNNAKAYLDKAMAIAQLRSPDRDDGTMARMMWRMSVVLDSDTYGTFQDEATALRNRAELAMREMSAQGEGGGVLVLDEEGAVDQNEMEDAFNSLVPGYLR
ncbi:uncharacterized protein RAG0_10529 [Rhynchosporium agropyri]|uniref:Uncharacterized protein n=1 Tax=Rhynchosporium agropyri TaxID=914238 RepID=A0A1E1L057_9HELO|nr:uncharacterized protein RAG0_10529 [Rhynchosporium agropyri]